MRMRLFQFSLRDQASNWLKRILAGSISTWEDLTTRFLAQFFPPRRTQNFVMISLCFNNIKESLSLKHGLVSRTYSKKSLIMESIAGSKFNFLCHVYFHLKCEIGCAANGKLREKNADDSWEIIKNLTLYHHEGWNDSKDMSNQSRQSPFLQMHQTHDRRLL
ncbi:zinc finger, CCHC-type containing protein [Tanacetum coccineum]